MDKAESEIARISLNADYSAAQKLYTLRGYLPDGRGLHWKDHYVR